MEAFRKWRYYLVYIPYSIEVFIDYLNYRYLTIKAKLNGKETRQIKELVVFNFIIIYCKRAKNLVDSLFRRSNFKDNNELFATKRQLLLNFLSKFQKHLEDIKNNPIKEQSIDFNKTFLSGNVLNLIRISQDTNSIGMLSIRNEFRDKCSGFVSNSIGYIQMKIFHLRLASIIKRSNN